MADAETGMQNAAITIQDASNFSIRIVFLAHERKHRTVTHQNSAQ